MKTYLLGMLLGLCAVTAKSQGNLAEKSFETDRFDTSAGKLEITFIGHGTLMICLDKLVIHVDPVSREADYTLLPKADLILITHEHGDHLDMKAIGQVRQNNTQIIVSQSCKGKIEGATVMANGEEQTIGKMNIKAVPAYNIVNMRDGHPYHPKGNGNGYLLTLGNKVVYIAGDTENIPEMADLKKVDIAFLPMNLPYTMTPEMVAAAARSFHPNLLYPYHMGNTDPQLLVELLKESGIETRIRKMK